MINVTCINQYMRNNMSANKGRHLTLFYGAAFVKAASICQTKMAEGDSYIMAGQIQARYGSKQISQSSDRGVSEINKENDCHYQRLCNFILQCKPLYPCERHLQSYIVSDHTKKAKQNKIVGNRGWLDYTCMHHGHFGNPLPHTLTEHGPYYGAFVILINIIFNLTMTN